MNINGDFEKDKFTPLPKKAQVISHGAASFHQKRQRNCYRQDNGNDNTSNPSIGSAVASRRT
jgi:hypothetical protein